MSDAFSRRSFSVLRSRDLALLLGGQTISMLGSMVSMVALPFAVFELTGSATAVGLAFAATYFPTVVFLLVGGVWADRLPRRRVMLSADVVRTVSRLALCCLLVTGRCTFAELLVLQAVGGLAEAFFRPAVTGLVPQTVPSGLLQQANGMRSLAESLSSVAGPVLGSLVVGLAGPAWAIGLDGATYAASAVTLAVMRLQEERREVGEESFFESLARGWSAFTARRWMWVMTLQAGVLFMVSAAPFYVLGPLAAEQTLGGAGAWGLVLAAAGGGEIAGGLLAIRFRPRRPLVACCLMSVAEAVPLALLAKAAPVGLAAAGAAAAGVSITFFTAVWDTTLQERIPEQLLSRVASYDWLGAVAFLPLGMALVGPASAVLGLQATLLGAAIATVVAGLAPLALQDVRRMSATAREVADEAAPGAVAHGAAGTAPSAAVTAA